MKRKCWLAFLLLVVITVFCSCSADNELSVVEGLDELGEVSVISREDGSGTRTAFAQLVGFDEEQDDKSDSTTDNALIVEDAEGVIQAVGDDTSAIGYVSMGTLDELENEKTLSVNGVSATLENVKSGDYELSRPFLLVWSGSLSELEQDFLTYTLGKGQAIVENSYVAVSESRTFLSGQYEGTITIHGSTSAAPLLEELANEYMSINTHAKVVIEASDSTTGINDALQGSCDFGMASRELESYEEELLEKKTIAKDGIAVIVNKDNPLDSVTIEELNELFTGAISDWSGINLNRGDS
ncbi:MAG: substrate-binding domain-containing protein [Ruminococcus sp.]|nr:substrate-binding domain-containing protein [Ruminococcus sp.]